jgi:hypothetical protein
MRMPTLSLPKSLQGRILPVRSGGLRTHTVYLDFDDPLFDGQGTACGKRGTLEVSFYADQIPVIFLALSANMTYI